MEAFNAGRTQKTLAAQRLLHSADESLIFQLQGLQKSVSETLRGAVVETEHDSLAVSPASASRGCRTGRGLKAF